MDGFQLNGASEVVNVPARRVVADADSTPVCKNSVLEQQRSYSYSMDAVMVCTSVATRRRSSVTAGCCVRGLCPASVSPGYSVPSRPFFCFVQQGTLCNVLVKRSLPSGRSWIRGESLLSKGACRAG